LVLSTEVRKVVAEFLAEAGAVHPKVHTSESIGRWLEDHGWTLKGSSEAAQEWFNESVCDRVFLYHEIPLSWVSVLHAAAAYTEISMEKILMEVAMMKEEVKE
jgi:hypothetical protein